MTGANFLPYGAIEKLTPADVSDLRDMVESAGWTVCVEKVFPGVAHAILRRIVEAKTDDEANAERRRFEGFAQTAHFIISAANQSQGPEKPKRAESFLKKHLRV